MAKMAKYGDRRVVDGQEEVFIIRGHGDAGWYPFPYEPPEVGQARIKPLNERLCARVRELEAKNAQLKTSIKDQSKIISTKSDALDKAEKRLASRKLATTAEVMNIMLEQIDDQTTMAISKTANIAVREHLRTIRDEVKKEIKARLEVVEPEPFAARIVCAVCGGDDEYQKAIQDSYERGLAAEDHGVEPPAEAADLLAPVDASSAREFLMKFFNWNSIRAIPEGVTDPAEYMVSHFLKDHPTLPAPKPEYGYSLEQVEETYRRNWAFDADNKEFEEEALAVFLNYLRQLSPQESPPTYGLTVGQVEEVLREEITPTRHISTYGSGLTKEGSLIHSIIEELKKLNPQEPPLREVSCFHCNQVLKTKDIGYEGIELIEMHNCQEPPIQGGWSKEQVLAIVESAKAKFNSEFCSVLSIEIFEEMLNAANIPEQKDKTPVECCFKCALFPGQGDGFCEMMDSLPVDDRVSCLLYGCAYFTPIKGGNDNA